MAIPAEAYTLFGAALGAGITLATTWLTQRSQHQLEREKIKESRAQLLFKEKADKVYQLATDLSAASYAFLWVTWSAEHDDLDQKTMGLYWADIQKIMPRLYAGYVAVAALDDELGEVAGSLVDQADVLDMSIGEAALKLTEANVRKLALLRDEAMQFAKGVAETLAEEMKRKRLSS